MGLIPASLCSPLRLGLQLPGLSMPAVSTACPVVPTGCRRLHLHLIGTLNLMHILCSLLSFRSLVSMASVKAAVTSDRSSSFALAAADSHQTGCLRLVSADWALVGLALLRRCVLPLL